MPLAYVSRSHLDDRSTVPEFGLEKNVRAAEESLLQTDDNLFTRTTVRTITSTYRARHDHSRIVPP